RNIADLYTLRWQDVSRLERWAEKSARNLVESIEASKKVPYQRVLFALGIRYVGETVAKKLAMAFTSVDKLMAASVEELVQVDEIGDRIAQSIVKYFGDSNNVEVVSKLKEFGLQFELSEDIISQRTDKLSGLTIVISGTFEKHSRDEYKAMIEQNGGKNSGSISAKTSYVLAGDNMGPAKLEKAESLGVKIISEDDFLAMVK
ncbi:MAG: helix-hairpin-helix domain-containing protein, partial [Dysgonomonas sp.]